MLCELGRTTIFRGVVEIWFCAVAFPLHHSDNSPLVSRYLCFTAVVPRGVPFLVVPCWFCDHVRHVEIWRQCVGKVAVDIFLVVSQS